MQELFRFISVDDEDRELRQSITGASELNYWRNAGNSIDSYTKGDTTEGSEGDVEGGEANAQGSSALVRGVLAEIDCTNLN